MISGQSYAVTVTITNTGNTVWTTLDKYKLGAQNPRDNLTWGFNRVTLPASVSVAPGASYSFNFTVKAPASPGLYNFRWQMLREGTGWFGDYTPNLSINVQ